MPVVLGELTAILNTWTSGVYLTRASWTLQNDFGKSLAAGFKGKAADYGIKIINEYEYSIKDRQFGSIVAKVKADSPDAIYASGYYFTAGPLVNQLRAAGVSVPIIGQEGYDSQKFIEIAGPSSEGVIITTSLDRDSEVPETKSFITAFEKKAGFKVDMVAASAHTAHSTGARSGCQFGIRADSHRRASV